MKAELWAATAITAIGGAFIYAALALPATPGQVYGAGFFPALVACVFAVSGLALALRTLYRMRFSPRRTAQDVFRWPGALPVIGVLLTYIAIVDRLGFHLTVITCLGVLLWTFTRRVWFSLVASVIFAVVVHLAFYGLFKVPLPWGLLQSIAW